MIQRSEHEIVVPRRVMFGTSSAEVCATGWIVRLSIESAQIESARPPAPGTDVILSAHLVDGDGPVTIPGRVQWATATRFSVELGPLDPRVAEVVVSAASHGPGGHRAGQ
jgi:hypothetical protein